MLQKGKLLTWIQLRNHLYPQLAKSTYSIPGIYNSVRQLWNVSQAKILRPCLCHQHLSSLSSWKYAFTTFITPWLLRALSYPFVVFLTIIDIPSTKLSIHCCAFLSFLSRNCINDHVSGLDVMTRRTRWLKFSYALGTMINNLSICYFDFRKHTSTVLCAFLTPARL